MAYRLPTQITRENVGSVEPNALLPGDTKLRPQVRGGLKQFFRNSIDAAGGSIAIDSAATLVAQIAREDSRHPLCSATPFRYAAPAEIPEYGTECTAEATARAAITNMWFMLERYDGETFAQKVDQWRKGRAVQWRAPIDDNFEIRVRGGSGAGTYSIDFGLGMWSPDSPWKYNELWRNGIDTVQEADMLGARFIRTGSGIKPDDDKKQQGFDKFRKTYGILPQRLLALVGLYYMRELHPDYSLAMTTKGACKLSTLNKSSGSCDYTEIFKNVGFAASEDANWLVVREFPEGFFNALDRAKIRRREFDALHAAVGSINNMQAVDATGQELDIEPIFTLCTDNSPSTVEREVALQTARWRR